MFRSSLESGSWADSSVFCRLSLSRNKTKISICTNLSIRSVGCDGTDPAVNSMEKLADKLI